MSRIVILSDGADKGPDGRGWRPSLDVVRRAVRKVVVNREDDRKLATNGREFSGVICRAGVNFRGQRIRALPYSGCCAVPPLAGLPSIVRSLPDA